MAIARRVMIFADSDNTFLAAQSFTGDSDFAYLAEKLRRRGMRVEVASVEQSLGNELKNAASSTIDLIEIFDSFEQQNNNQTYYRIGNATIFD
jgi:uncharacterized LabA/DUF88 family protein